MRGNDTRLFIMSRIMIPIRLCSLPVNSPGIYMLEPTELCMEIMVGECMCDAWVIN